MDRGRDDVDRHVIGGGGDARDFRPGAERACAYPPARQLFGDETHRGFPKPEAAIFLRDAHAEDGDDDRGGERRRPFVIHVDRRLGEKHHPHMEGSKTEQEDGESKRK